MKRVITGLLIIVGLINFYPIIGVLSEQRLLDLYQIETVSNDVIILLRHRAVLFGLLGAFLVYAAFKPQLQWSAIIVGLVSMVSFIVLALLVGEYGGGIRKVFIADMIALFILFVVIILRIWLVKI